MNTQTLQVIENETREYEVDGISVIEHETREYEVDGISVIEAIESLAHGQSRDLEWFMRDIASTPYACIYA